MCAGNTLPGETYITVTPGLADLLAVAVWILQIAITSVTSHVMKSYLISWLDDFIHEKKGQRNTYWN